MSAGVHFREEHNDEDSDKIIVRIDDMTRNIFVEYFKDIFITKIEQRIKKACDFYLRYKDSPKLFWKEQHNYRNEFYKLLQKLSYLGDLGVDMIDGMIESAFQIPFDDEGASEQNLLIYNEWLFKLAFKDVMGDENAK